jgi:hypothetical protein
MPASRSEQWTFIKHDLEAASTPQARQLRPWIVVWSHRPLYCSDLMTWEDRCIKQATECVSALLNMSNPPESARLPHALTL